MFVKERVSECVFVKERVENASEAVIVIALEIQSSHLKYSHRTCNTVIALEIHPRKELRTHTNRTREGACANTHDTKKERGRESACVRERQRKKERERDRGRVSEREIVCAREKPEVASRSGRRT